MEYYAHSPGENGEWHLLRDHLESVGEKAREFASFFESGDLAQWLGALHDVGKINLRFQEYLRAPSEEKTAQKAPHSIWGAALLYRALRGRGESDGWKDLALPIMAHHGALPDGGVAEQSLLHFMVKNPDAIQTMKTYIQEADLKLPKCTAPPLSRCRREMRIRMLYSALIDADRLDTEEHFDPDQAAERSRWPDLSELWTSLEAKQHDLFAQLVSDELQDTKVKLHPLFGAGED